MLTQNSQFAGDGSTKDFDLAAVVAAGSAPLVSVNGVVQHPSTPYSVATVGSVSRVTFIQASADGDKVLVLYQIP